MPDFMKIAHRGYSSRFPENTVTAFEQAILNDADMIELDIHLSKDGEIVVIHDDTINRTSDGQGLVKGLSFQELRSYNYNNGFNCQRKADIPSLEEVIELVRGHVLLNIEIKNCPVRHFGIEDKLIRLLKRMNFIEDVIVSSFDHYSLLDINKLEPSLKTGMLYESVWLNFMEEVEMLSVYSIHPGIDAIQPARPDQMISARKKGIRVFPWVAHDSTTISELTSSGLIDGIMVNELKLFNE